jgi:hypothetical protein
MASTGQDVAHYLESTLFHTLSREDAEELKKVNESVVEKLMSLRNNKLIKWKVEGETGEGEACCLTRSCPPPEKTGTGMSG